MKIMIGKLNILVICGGKSSEHSISCLSAISVINNLNKEKYNVDICYISKNGIFLKYLRDKEKLKDDEFLKEQKEILIEVTDFKKYFASYDVVLPILHGKYGEDGTIQGMLEMMNVKYIGNDVMSSSIGIDKIMSKILAKEAGVNIVNYAYVSAYEYVTNELLEKKMDDSKLKYPVFVKPNREGSSYGAKKASNIDELVKAVKEAMMLDKKVLIEEYIDEKKEVECAILGDNDLVVSLPGEIVSETEIYDFNSKYNSKKSYTKIPADISKDNINKIMEDSEKIYRALNLCSLARVDFFVTSNNIYFNEINTMPGFTSISMYPKMIENMGISYSELLDRLIAMGINR